MKIALIGYGNMGQEIAGIIERDKKHEIVSVSYRDINDPLDIKGIKKADVAINFTSPQIILRDIQRTADLGINMVVGTTGWYDKTAEVKQIVKKSKIGFIYAQNFSVGVNLFFQIAGFASKIISNYDFYDVYGLEIHHRGKQDSPSGTAKKLAEIVMRNFPKKRKLETGRIDRKIGHDELHFVSVRAGTNPGQHEIIFDSPADDIQVIHRAKNRSGFAEGAIVAAEFINEKKGFYHFDELFKSA